MIKFRTTCLIFIMLAWACDKQDSSIDKPEMQMKVEFSGAINENWVNEDGWFVINQLYSLKDRNQLSITLAKGYTNLSIVFAAKENNLHEGTYPLLSKMTNEDCAQAEYYILGSRDIYKSFAGALTISELSDNKVKGFINGTFMHPEKKENLFVEGSFTLPPIF